MGREGGRESVLEERGAEGGSGPAGPGGAGCNFNYPGLKKEEGEEAREGGREGWRVE